MNEMVAAKLASVEFVEDKENIPQNCISDNQIVSPLLTKGVETASFYSFISTDVDIENAHHLSSARNSWEKVNAMEQYRHVESSQPIQVIIDAPKVIIDAPSTPLKDAEIVDENVQESPNTTIMTLKKGQRIKDGMILMLTGQVDRRKQLLLGAQVNSMNNSL